MRTRLGRYCDGVIEAGWLAAAILTPLFFNVYSSRVFEPDKATLLRSVGLVMAVAWLIRTAEQVRSDDAGSPSRPGTGEVPLVIYWRRLTGTPLLPQVLLLVLVYLLATAFSIVPHTSFWGSYQRLQGTYTTLGYLVIFFLAWQSLRTRAQLERLLNVVVLTSLPVALCDVLRLTAAPDPANPTPPRPRSPSPPEPVPAHPQTSTTRRHRETSPAARQPAAPPRPRPENHALKSSSHSEFYTGGYACSRFPARAGSPAAGRLQMDRRRCPHPGVRLEP